MICPQCGSEYREGFTMCSDCDVPLVASRGERSRGVAAPVVQDDAYEDEIGDGELADDDLAWVADTHDPEELGAFVEGLEEAMIPYVLQAGTALALLDGDALREDGEPDDWRARVAVPAAEAPQAKAMWAQLRDPSRRRQARERREPGDE